MTTLQNNKTKGTVFCSPVIFIKIHPMNIGSHQAPKYQCFCSEVIMIKTIKSRGLGYPFQSYVFLARLF